MPSPFTEINGSVHLKLKADYKKAEISITEYVYFYREMFVANSTNKNI